MIDLLIPTGKRACDYCTKAGKCILGFSVSSNYSGMPQGMKRVSCEAGLIDFGIYSADVSTMIADAVHGRQRIPAIRPAEGETERLDSLEREELKTLRKRVSEQRHEIARLHDANNSKAEEITYLQDQHRRLSERMLEVKREQFLKTMKAKFVVPAGVSIPAGMLVKEVDMPGQFRCDCKLDPPVIVDDPALRQFLGLNLKEVPKPSYKQNKVVVDIDKDSGAFLGIAINGVELPGATGYGLDQNFGTMPTLNVEFGILPRNIIIREMQGKAVGE